MRGPPESSCKRNIVKTYTGGKICGMSSRAWYYASAWKDEDNDLASVDDPSGAEFPGGFDVPAVQVVAHASLHSAHLEQRISYAHKYKNNNKQKTTLFA